MREGPGVGHTLGTPSAAATRGLPDEHVWAPLLRLLFAPGPSPSPGQGPDLLWSRAPEAGGSHPRGLWGALFSGVGSEDAARQTYTDCVTSWQFAPLTVSSLGVLVPRPAQPRDD